VLITGATGFVGAHLVRELLVRGDRRVICLARAENAEKARERVLANLARYGIELGARARAIEGLAGDLAARRLGLQSPQYDSLAAEVELVISNGAWIHLTHPYEVLRPTNVAGTGELLRLCMLGRPKAMCHVSGMSVFHDAPTMVENGPPPDSGSRHGGYFDSKWVSDRLVWSAFERGLPGLVVRLGWTSGDSRSGLIPSSDAMTMFLRACVRLRAAPKLPGGRLIFVPVDVAARVIAEGALAAPNFERGLGCNLWSTHRVPEEELWARVAQHGIRVELLEAEHWLAKLSGRFALLTPVAKTILGAGQAPAIDDREARGLIGKIGALPASEHVLDNYIRAWLR
jgi:thioester reductase-like protein